MQEILNRANTRDVLPMTLIEYFYVSRAPVASKNRVAHGRRETH
jgi:hypothetical protein